MNAHETHRHTRCAEKDDELKLSVEQAASCLEKIAQAENLKLEPGAAARIAQRARAVPRDCLGMLYDLFFEGREITVAAVEALRGGAE